MYRDITIGALLCPRKSKFSHKKIINCKVSHNLGFYCIRVMVSEFSEKFKNMVAEFSRKKNEKTYGNDMVITIGMSSIDCAEYKNII